MDLHEHAERWLRSKLVVVAGANLARDDAFTAYASECLRDGVEHVANNVFGKLFKKVFPGVISRRLGQRGKNKMCYVNIQWRDKISPEEEQRIKQLEATPPSGAPPQPLTWVTIDEGKLAARTNHAPTSETEDNTTTTTKRSSRKRRVPDEINSATATSSSTSCLSSSASSSSSSPSFSSELYSPNSSSERRSIISAGDSWDNSCAHSSSGTEEELELEDREGSKELIVSSSRSSWCVGAHLTLLFTINRYRNYFREQSYHIIPLNPQCLKLSALSYLLTTTEGSEEVSPLALCAYTMISIASFVHGDLHISEEYFHKAREQLGALFDEPDYDVACALKPLAWWARVCASSAEDGKRKELYYATIGAKMCESLGAINDETNEGFIRMLALHEMRNPDEQIARNKQHPPWDPIWRRRKPVVNPISTTIHGMICSVYGTVLLCYSSRMAGAPPTAEEARLLHHQLEASHELLQTIRSRMLEPQAPEHILAILASQALALRAITYMLLNSPKQFESARELILFLAGTLDKPLTAMVLLELASNEYLLIRIIIDILSSRSDNQILLRVFDDALKPYCPRYYWMQWIHEYLQSAMQSLNERRSQRLH